MSCSLFYLKPPRKLPLPPSCCEPIAPCSNTTRNTESGASHWAECAARGAENAGARGRGTGHGGGHALEEFDLEVLLHRLEETVYERMGV